MSAGPRTPYSGPVFLRVQLLNGRTEVIALEEGNSPEEELARFVSRQGRYAEDWVPLGKEEGKTKPPYEYVRYDQIVSVKPVKPKKMS